MTLRISIPFVLVIAFAFTAALPAAGPARAETYTAEKLKQLVAGNTILIKRSQQKGRESSDYMYLREDGVLKGVKEVSQRGSILNTSDFTSSWEVRPDGALCFVSYVRQNVCRTLASIKKVDDKKRLMIMKGTGTDGDSRVLLFKGNPKKL